MKLIHLLPLGGCLAALGTLPLHAQNETRGVDVRGADVKGADVRGADVQGGSVTGGSVTGGSVSGGTVTPGTVSPGMVTAFADGREIRVSSVDSVSINVNGGTANVKLGDRNLAIEKARVLLDGKPLGNLPADAKKVEVRVVDGALSIKSDGKETITGKLK